MSAASIYVSLGVRESMYCYPGSVGSLLGELGCVAEGVSDSRYGQSQNGRMR